MTYQLLQTSNPPVISGSNLESVTLCLVNSQSAATRLPCSSDHILQDYLNLQFYVKVSIIRLTDALLCNEFPSYVHLCINSHTNEFQSYHVIILWELSTIRQKHLANGGFSYR